jgi:hypothetical protein
MNRPKRKGKKRIFGRYGKDELAFYFPILVTMSRATLTAVKLNISPMGLLSLR